MLEEYVCTWDDPAGIPKRTRNGDFARADWRCMAPGCTCRADLEAHHIVYRSHEGSDAPENILILCPFHHRQGEHGGLAHFEGVAPLAVNARLGRAGVGTWYRNERRLGIAANVASVSA